MFRLNDFPHLHCTFQLMAWSVILPAPFWRWGSEGETMSGPILPLGVGSAVGDWALGVWLWLQEGPWARTHLPGLRQSNPQLAQFPEFSLFFFFLQRQLNTTPKHVCQTWQKIRKIYIEIQIASFPWKTPRECGHCHLAGVSEKGPLEMSHVFPGHATCLFSSLTLQAAERTVPGPGYQGQSYGLIPTSSIPSVGTGGHVSGWEGPCEVVAAPPLLPWECSLWPPVSHPSLGFALVCARQQWACLFRAQWVRCWEIPPLEVGAFAKGKQGSMAADVSQDLEYFCKSKFLLVRWRGVGVPLNSCSCWFVEIN